MNIQKIDMNLQSILMILFYCSIKSDISITQAATLLYTAILKLMNRFNSYLHALMHTEYLNIINLINPPDKHNASFCLSNST